MQPIRESRQPLPIVPPKASLHGLAMPASVDTPAQFESEHAAIAFARAITVRTLGLTNARVGAAAHAGWFEAQVYLRRELAVAGSSEVPGTVVVNARGEVTGLRFCAHTEECNSGQECVWIEDFQGHVVKSALEWR